MRDNLVSEAGDWKNEVGRCSGMVDLSDRGQCSKWSDVERVGQGSGMRRGEGECIGSFGRSMELWVEERKAMWMVEGRVRLERTREMEREWRSSEKGAELSSRGRACS